MAYIPLTIFEAWVGRPGYKTVVWDWNGTIVEDAWFFVELMNGYLKKQGLPSIDIASYRKNFCFPVIDYYRQLGFNITDEEFRDLGKQFISDYIEGCKRPKLYKGIVDLIRFNYDSGIVQCVLSAQRQDILRMLVGFYGLEKYFSAVIGLDNDYAYGKIDRAHDLSERLNLDPSSTLMIGDTNHDKDVADSLGWSCVLLSTGHQSTDRLLATSASIADNPLDLKKYIYNH